ncbi:mitochondrial intermediate peptidase isoform X2 [Anopheles stephensi]|uniref:mitochondrial intermediate peptidase isoform X2 n=1 Tax=Anopheles stephensi TaxID=30069 RepID=UPI0016589D79|nr:mitochondrial intermediate peptidase isoform X2 [Anopheles stephensi]
MLKQVIKTYEMLRRMQTLSYNSRWQRMVTTWSPLTTAFNTRPEKRINFTKNEGLFGIPELTSHEGFYVLKEKAIFKTDDLIEEATSPARTRKMVMIFDELSDTLCKVADLSEFVRLTHPAVNYCSAAEDACITISGIVEKLNTHKTLYNALKTVVDDGDTFETTDVDKHVAKLFLFDFEQSGIHLEEAARQRVVFLNDCILQQGQRFMAGAVNPRRIARSILPVAILPFFPSDGDNILVSGLYADSANNIARESAYRLFLYPDAEQERLLSEMLKCRHELATVCGFPTYAHRALKASTVETPEMVDMFLDALNEQLQPRAAKDFAIMQKMKTSECGSNVPLAAWDTPYYTSCLKRKYLQASASEFSPYFSLGACMEGLNLLMNRLFGINLKNVEMEPGETWSYDIYKLAVVHETEGLLGFIYCDLFERQGKPNQDCHFTIQGGKVLPDGSFQNPIVVVMLNLSQPRWSGPTLLTPSMVDNLFHEMGHAMHSMLARTEYQHVTGTRCSTDFAEVPSVLMEYFANDPRVIRSFAKHFQTQEPMPEEMLERLCTSKHLFASSETQLQVFYSALDQVYHGDHNLHRENTTATLRMVQEKYYGLPYVENTAWQLRFSHLVGYGAKYYSYLISKAIASWIWQTYFEQDPFSRNQGEKYRRGCLAYGGGIPSRLLVSNFLGRDINPTNLTSSLINEIDNCAERLKYMDDHFR